MARRLRAAMALMLFQALPEGLPASVEPAQVGGSPGGAGRMVQCALGGPERQLAARGEGCQRANCGLVAGFGGSVKVWD